jgi:glycerophosphoryl diester phosphodiesterase
VSGDPGRRLFGDDPTVIGHRGFGKGVVVDGHGENTLASFGAALAAGVEWLETDVRACRDGTLVLAHHPTDPDGRFFSDLTGDEARAAGVVTLDELLDWAPEGVGLDLEVKTSLEDALRPRAATTAGLLARCAARLRGARPLLVTSFDPAALLIVRETTPDVPIGLMGWIAYPLRKVIPAAAHLGCEVVVVHKAAFGPNRTDPAPVHRDVARSVEVAHDAGLEVAAWCPAPGEIAPLVDGGVDAVVVDDVRGVRAAFAA